MAKPEMGQVEGVSLWKAGPDSRLRKNVCHRQDQVGQMLPIPSETDKNI